MRIFKHWMNSSTALEKKQLAKSVDTHPNYLYEIAAERRICTADLAMRIEKHTRKMAKKSGYRLPVVPQSDLSPVCAKCPHFRNCGI